MWQRAHLEDCDASFEWLPNRAAGAYFPKRASPGHRQSVYYAGSTLASSHI